jgi:DegV family protein with EDD domain
MHANDQQRLDRGNTAIVVDSCADLPATLRDDANLTMVPLNVHFGDEVFRDWIDIEPVRFYQRLRTADKLPTTSQPSAGAFIEAYRRLRLTYAHVFSLHLSSRLSGTFASASLAEVEIEGVTVVDTGMASVAISLLADRILAMLDRGTTAEELLAYVQRFQRESGFIFMVDTLEFLQKGGRIGRASSIAGGLLHIKPLLTLVDGEVDVYTKVRGSKKAFAAMVEYFLERTQPGHTVFVTVADADAPDKARELRAVLEATDRTIDVRFVGEVGPVIGTYAGPGAVALFFVSE